MTRDKATLDRIVDNLHCSIAEAIEIYDSDKAIDKGLPQDFDLTPEQKKVAQKMTHTGTRKPTAYKFKQRERKPDAPKEEIIAEIAKFLQENAPFQVNNCVIANVSKLITFEVNGENYKIDLTRTRKPKK